MRTLEYAPRAAPRPAASDHTQTIGVLSLGPIQSAKPSALLAIHQATRNSDHVVSTVTVPVRDHDALRSAVARLRRVYVDGILAVAPPSGAIDVLVELSGDIPLVAVATGPQEGVSAVAIDQYAGGAAATSHLLELGHRTVFHIAGPAEGRDPGRGLSGWRDTLVRAGAEIPLPMVGDSSPEAGYELGCRLGSRPDVTAIFVAGDQMALGVLRALHEAGRRVPEEVSVVGCDGAPEAEFFNPPLTTIRHDYAELGRRSLELLLEEIEVGAHANVHETIPAELIVRASTAAVHARTQRGVL
ncbi:MAG TPA: substrate-binding domain-containing protein [Solirubrobacteraceae bacterium]|nr:substrate-binding domain-containing protein [Solirubrobacteraceae bacterium]